jgi:hypothetical protein
LLAARHQVSFMSLMRGFVGGAWSIVSIVDRASVPHRLRLDNSPK